MKHPPGTADIGFEPGYVANLDMWPAALLVREKIRSDTFSFS